MRATRTWCLAEEDFSRGIAAPKWQATKWAIHICLQCPGAPEDLKVAIAKSSKVRQIQDNFVFPVETAPFSTRPKRARAPRGPSDPTDAATGTLAAGRRDADRLRNLPRLCFLQQHKSRDYI